MAIECWAGRHAGLGGRCEIQGSHGLGLTLDGPGHLLARLEGRILSPPLQYIGADGGGRPDRGGDVSADRSGQPHLGGGSEILGSHWLGELIKSKLRINAN